VDEEEQDALTEGYLDIVLLVFLIVITVAILWLRSLVAVVMLSGLYSLVMAAVWVLLDAVDVAFTEAAVGAGITTVLFLAALALTGSREKPPTHGNILPLLVVFVTGAALIYGTLGSLGSPPFADALNPAQVHVAPYYLERAVPETSVPNVVTAVLASYRGYDTLGEVTVIFTAGIGVLLLIGRAPRRRRKSR
jgi:multicomponent Na+:H+ antiporter subunit B